MNLSQGVKKLWSGKTQGSSQRSRNRRLRPALCLEAIEDRVVPAAISWQGTTTSWNTAANWSTNAVPTSADTVTIVPTNGTTVTAEPVLDTYGNLDSLSINAGASLDGGIDQFLFVYGNNSNFTNNGTFNANTGTVSFNAGGGGVQTIGGTVNTTFNNLLINTTGSTVTLGRSATVAGNFTLSGGTFTESSNPFISLSVGGNFIHNGGTFNANFGLTIFNGTTAQTIGGIATTFDRLEINNAAGVTLTEPATTITGLLDLNIGVFTDPNLTMANNATQITRENGSLTAAPIFAGPTDILYASTNTTPITTGLELPTSATALHSLSLINSATVTLAAGVNPVVNGTFDLEGASAAFSAGANTLTVKGNFTNNASATAFNAGTGTVVLAGSNQTLSGSTNFFNLTKKVTAAATLTFQAGNTQTVSGILTLQGASGQLLKLRSATPGTQWNIKPTSASVSFVDVQDSKNTAATAIAAASSVNSGNNTNWSFISATIQTLTSTTANGTYGVGTVIPIKITFSAAVTLAGGNLTINLNDGGTVTLTPFTGTTATGNYTVAAGDTASPLDTNSPLVLAAGATLKDAFNNPVALTFPAAASFKATDNIIVNTTAATIQTLTSTTANGTYGVGTVIPIKITFSAAVTLAGGNLTINLNDGGTVTLTPFTGTTATGNYTVAASDTASALDTNTPLVLAAGATLKDANNNPVALTFPENESLKATSTAIVINTSTGGGGGGGNGVNGALAFSAATYTANEGSTVTLTVTRTGGTTGAVTVAYAVSQPSGLATKYLATPNGDYTGAASGTVTFNDGDTTKTITFPVTADNLVEENEQFVVTLSQPTGAAVLGSVTTTTVTILDTNLPVVSNATPKLPTLQKAGIGFGTSDEHYQQFVRAAYDHYLRRKPSDAEVKDWVDKMKAYQTDHTVGLKQEQIEAGFIDSKEYIGRFGSVGKAWIDGIYQDLLVRAPDASGEGYWLGQLAKGVDPTLVALGFTTSLERLQNRVSATYLTLLERPADAAGLAYWVNIFNTGGTTEDINSGFVGSTEYYAKKNGAAGNPAKWVREAYLDVLFRAAQDPELAYWVNFLNG